MPCGCESIGGEMAVDGESSMQVVLRDGGVVTNIVSKLRTAQDRYAAALVCRLWHDVVTWQASKLALRTRSSLPHLVRPFKHIVALDLTCVDEQLTDSDLEFCALSFGHLRWLSVGHSELPQDKISDTGLFAIADRCGSLEHLSLSCMPGIGDEGIRGLSTGCPSLRALTLHNCRNLTDFALEAICDFSTLVELQLKGEFGFTSTGLARIGSELQALMKVCFELGSLNIDPALKSLAEGCPKLRDLSLNFQKASLGELVKCTSLCSLAVETYQGVPMDGPIIAISKANTNLQELVFLNRVAPLTDSSVISVVRKCAKLEKLHLEASKLTGVAILCIVNCKTLQHLILENLKSRGEGLADIGLCGMGLKRFALINARGLSDMQLQTIMDQNNVFEDLDLESCLNLTSIGISAIAACRNLQRLNLSYTQVDDVSLLTIASGVHNLVQLSLIRCTSLTSIASISRFKTLEVLNVDQCPHVCDEGLQALAVGCSRLTYLSLAFTRVSDVGLSYLRACSLLRNLRVSYCQYVKGWGVVDLAEACVGFQHVIMSHRFRDSPICATLKEYSCKVSLEMDGMALVPFGYNLQTEF